MRAVVDFFESVEDVENGEDKDNPLFRSVDRKTNVMCGLYRAVVPACDRCWASYSYTDETAD